MRSILQAGALEIRRHVDQFPHRPQACQRCLRGQGYRFFKQGALEIRRLVGDRRISGVSSRFCVGLRVFYGPILFGPFYTLALLQRFLILLRYQIHVATTLRFVAISLSLAATTIKSLQYNNHITTPLVCVTISKLPFPTTWYASQHLCFHLQRLNFVLP